MSMEIGIDEFSLVLQSNEQVNSYDWSDTAQRIIYRFCDKAKIVETLGDLEVMTSKLASGYNSGFCVNPAFGYLCFAYHSLYATQGILIRFSATALMFYRQKYKELFGNEIYVYELLQQTMSTSYSSRTSRVDIAVDYFNVNDSYNPTVLYNGLTLGDLKIVDRNNRCAKRNISAHVNGDSVHTIYCGSKAEKSPLVVRYYNKKEQQLSTFGCQYDRAVSCKNWYRLELSFRHKLAHQIGDNLMLDVHTPQEFRAYLAQCVLDKVRFYSNETQTYILLTQSLLSAAESCDLLSLSTSVPKDNSLKKSLTYIISQSGLFSLLYRVGEIWGNHADIELLHFIYKIYQENFVLEAPKNPRIMSWLRNHAESLKNIPLSELLNYSSFPIEPKILDRKDEQPPFDLVTLTPLSITENPTDTEKHINAINSKPSDLNSHSKCKPLDTISSEDFQKLFTEDLSI